MPQPTPIRPSRPMKGEVWDVDFDPRVGREQGGRRPALVISNDIFNREPNGLHFVVPMTRTDRGLRFQVVVNPPEGGLTNQSVIMCEQAKSTSIQRFVRYRGRLAPATVERVQAVVAGFLDR